MKPVEVAMVVGKMVGGGVEAIVMAYLKHIDREKVHFTCLVDSDSTCVPEDEIIRSGAGLIYIPPYQRQTEYRRALYRIFSERKFDAVHSHINALSVFPLSVAKRAGIPVRIAHSHSTAGRGETAKNAVKNILRPFSRLFPTKLCACGEYAGRWLFGRHAEFDILPNNLDFEGERFAFDASARARVRKELGIENRFAVGHIGRFIPQKNHFFVLSVFAEILKIRPDAVLLFAGQGELAESVRERVRIMGLDKSVVFLGQISDTAKLYSAMDVLLLPSLYEGKPLTAMEAQYASLPVLMSDRITDEAVLNPDAVQKLPLELPPAAWAECALSIAQKAVRESGRIRIGNNRKGIAPEDLSDWYVSQCAGGGAEKAECSGLGG